MLGAKLIRKAAVLTIVGTLLLGYMKNNESLQKYYNGFRDSIVPPAYNAAKDGYEALNDIVDSTTAQQNQEEISNKVEPETVAKPETLEEKSNKLPWVLGAGCAGIGLYALRRRNIKKYETPNYQGGK